MNWQETVIGKEHIKKANTSVLKRHGLSDIILAPVIEFSDEERIKIIEEQERERLESQAKATWEARQKEVDEAEQRGIRKVVEWIKNQRVLKSKDKSMIVIEFQTEEWQAFLKECKFDK